MGRFCLHSAGAVWSHAEHSTSPRGNFGNEQLFARSKPVLREALVLPGAGADLPPSTQSLQSCSTSVQSSPVCSANTRQRFFELFGRNGLTGDTFIFPIALPCPTIWTRKGKGFPCPRIYPANKPLVLLSKHHVRFSSAPFVTALMKRDQEAEQNS